MARQQIIVLEEGGGGGGMIIALFLLIVIVGSVFWFAYAKKVWFFAVKTTQTGTWTVTGTGTTVPTTTVAWDGTSNIVFTWAGQTMSITPPDRDDAMWDATQDTTAASIQAAAARLAAATAKGHTLPKNTAFGVTIPSGITLVLDADYEIVGPQTTFSVTRNVASWVARRTIMGDVTGTMAPQ